MNRTILAFAAAALGFAGTASAAEKAGQWYVTPMASVIWADDARYTDDDVGVAASFGKAVSEEWNIELHAFGYQMDGFNPTDLWGGGIDAARVWFRDSRITPYMLVGLGWGKKNRGFGADSDAPYTNLGFGFLTDITRNSSIALRTELRYRMELDDEKTYQDLIANIGVQIPF